MRRAAHPGYEISPCVSVPDRAVTAAVPVVPTPATEAAKAPGAVEADDVEDVLIEGAFDSENALRSPDERQPCSGSSM
jgi:hypothetical protein